MTEDATNKLIAKLRREYMYVELKGDNIVAVHQMMFTTAILSECSYSGYEDRWCYDDPVSAFKALSNWSGEPGSEPAGWHRHPTTGRRRPGGDETKEYINR